MPDVDFEHDATHSATSHRLDPHSPTSIGHNVGDEPTGHAPNDQSTALTKHIHHDTAATHTALPKHTRHTRNDDHLPHDTTQPGVLQPD